MRTILVAILLLTSIPLFATPSGLTWIPNTDTQAKKVWHLDADTYIYSTNPTGATANAPFVEEGVLYGVSSRVEAGIDYAAGFVNAPGARVSPLLLNAKYQFVTPSTKYPVAFAVGAYNVSPLKAANAQLLYVNGSYSFNKSLSRVTFGGYTGRKSVIGSDNSGYLLGVEDNIRKWWLTADYQSGENLYGAWNGGVGYNLTPKLLVFAGYDHYNSPTTVGAKSSVNVQVDINL